MSIDHKPIRFDQQGVPEVKSYYSAGGGNSATNLIEAVSSSS